MNIQECAKIVEKFIKAPLLKDVIFARNSNGVFEYLKFNASTISYSLGLNGITNSVYWQIILYNDWEFSGITFVKKTGLTFAEIADLEFHLPGCTYKYEKLFGHREFAFGDILKESSHHYEAKSVELIKNMFSLPEWSIRSHPDFPEKP